MLFRRKRDNDTQIDIRTDKLPVTMLRQSPASRYCWRVQEKEWQPMHKAATKLKVLHRASINLLFREYQVRFFLDGVPLEFTPYTFGISNVPVNLITG